MSLSSHVTSQSGEVQHNILLRNIFQFCQNWYWCSDDGCNFILIYDFFFVHTTYRRSIIINSNCIVEGIAVRNPMFNYTSFIAYKTLHDALMQTQVILMFKALTVEDSLLLYDAQTDEGKGDFISLAIKNRRVEFRFNSGSGIACFHILHSLGV